MIKCLICGIEKEYSIAEHIKFVHNINTKQYRELYNAETRSIEHKQLQTKTMKERWRNKEYSLKMKKHWKKYWKKEKNKIAQSKRIKKKYNDGLKNWCNGLTKENNESLKAIGEKNSKNLKGRNKITHKYIADAAIKRNITIARKVLNGESFAGNKNMSEERKILWRKRISESISKKYANGEVNNINNQYKTGWYKNHFDSYWYSSSYELEAMIFFDSLNLQWTNKHKIRIKYFIDNIQHYYVPDFLVIINKQNYIIEMKGRDSEQVKIKENAAKQIYQNYLLFFNLEQLKEKVWNLLK